MGAISQGLLFIEGHLVQAASDQRRSAHVHQCARDARRHERARNVLIARRLRQMTSLSVFR